MDANNTRFHVLMGRRDWEPLAGAPGSGLYWDDAEQGVTLHPLLYLFRPPGRVTPAAPADRRGAARDMFGNWYWIGHDRTEILTLRAGEQTARRFWPPPAPAGGAAGPGAAGAPAPGAFGPAVPPAPPAPSLLAGLAITGHQYLVAGVLDPAGLLVLDVHGGGLPHRVTWPVAVPFAPFDLAPMPGGGLWALDRDGRRYWALDDGLRVIGREQPAVPVSPPPAADFRPVTGDPPVRAGRTFPGGLTLDAASPLAEHNPVAIAGLPDGTVLILDTDPAGGASTLSRYRFASRVGGPVPLVIPADLVVPGSPAPSPLRGHDIAFVPAADAADGQVAGILYMADVDGNQAFAFRLTAASSGLELELLQRYLPMRSYGARALVAAGEDAWYDRGSHWAPLTEQERPRYMTEGRLTTAALDGRQPDTVWHRVFLDACIPPGTAVRLESRAGNDPDRLAEGPWQEEPAPYLRSGGAELPYYRPFGPAEARQEGTGTWETLLQQARGRYVELRLTLTGTGRATPEIHALRAYYPRFSYLEQYLPDVYQEDEISAGFLERYLANPEGLFTALEDRIAQAQFLLDVRTAPAEYLDWLAGWFEVTLDPAWDEPRRRLFIAHAHELFGQRGTLPGLIRAIRLATDPCPDDTLFTDDVSAYTGRIGFGGARVRFIGYAVRVVEEFLTRRVSGVVFGDPTDLPAPGVVPEHFQWTPAAGAQPLHDRYAAFLREQYGHDGAALMPPVLPDGAEGDRWRRFLREGLGFTYAAVDAGDLLLYQEFLAGRYRRVADLNAAWRRTYQKFSDVPLPAQMPPDGRPLFDWIQFVSVYVPAARGAHRFTVLVPAAGAAGAPAGRLSADMVRRIVNLEKPGHTEFAVKEYWALFQVGTARLGLDTLLDRGGRLAPLILGAGELAGSFLPYPHPWNVGDRWIIGRDAVGL